MKELPEGWESTQVALPNDLTREVETRTVFRRTPAPAPGGRSGVIVLHELPYMRQNVFDFADGLVAKGHEVRMPNLFGAPLEGGLSALGADFGRFCIRKEFAVLARGRTSPVVGWLRALANAFADELQVDGVGVVGMCFTGGFALAMLADARVLAPVLAEPSLPFHVGLTPARRASRGADLGLSRSDLNKASDRKIDVIGLRYASDCLTGTRFARLEEALGDRFFAVEFDGTGHSVFTKDQQPVALVALEDFLDDKLKGGDGALWRRTIGSQPDRRAPVTESGA
ncbi:MAG: dienelactone hydrolase family protein [Microbacterium sp.]